MAVGGPEANGSSDIHHRAERLAATMPPLLVAAERVASTVSQGVHGRRRVGQGETFWQFRRYGFGDSTQLIDWRQSAKSQPVYVRETEWEAAQSVWLWRDGSASMRFRSAERLPSKTDRAGLLILALASLLVRGGERVALLETGMTPASGHGALTRMWSMIEGDQTPVTSLLGIEMLPRYARVVLIGDFLSPLEEIKAAISAFADIGVRGHLLQVLDPAEELLPYKGRILFDGLEGEGDVLVRRGESLRDEYRNEVESHKAGLACLATAMGWSFASHRTDHPPETALMVLYRLLSEMLETKT